MALFVNAGSLALAQLLRLPSINAETPLHDANECSIDALLRLVGEKDTYLNDGGPQPAAARDVRLRWRRLL
jgi:hypothetical protein